MEAGDPPSVFLHCPGSRWKSIHVTDAIA